MVRTRLAYWLLIPLAFMLMGARQIPLLDPGPIAVPAGLDIKAISKAIRVGLAQRNWIVSKDEPGNLEATLTLRSHVARISVAYDRSNVRVAYAGSDNLMYEEKKSGRVIHRNYQTWINNVVGDISSALQVAAVQAEK